MKIYTICKDIEERNEIITYFFNKGYYDNCLTDSYRTLDNIFDLFEDCTILTYGEDCIPLINREYAGEWKTLEDIGFSRNDEFFRMVDEKPSKLVLGLGLGLVAGGICLAYKLRG